MSLTKTGQDFELQIKKAFQKEKPRFILIYQASKDYDIPLDVCQSIYEKDSTSFYDNLVVYIKERRLKANGR